MYHLCEGGPSTYHLDTLLRTYHPTPTVESVVHSLYDHHGHHGIAYSMQGAYALPEYRMDSAMLSVIYGGKDASAVHYGRNDTPEEVHREYHFTPDLFLLPGKGGMFVGSAEDVREFVEEAFFRLFGEQFPEDIKISILDEERFTMLAPSTNTVGMSLNRRQQGLMSEIFVRHDTLGRVLLTIGHELGHVLTPTLENQHDEEAKAYAFSLLWMETIREHDIAGLQKALVEEIPAENGLHDIAFAFVQRMLRKGKKVSEIYTKIIAGFLPVSSVH